MFLYSDDGFKCETVGPDIVSVDGQVIFDHEATEEELSAVFSNYLSRKEATQNPTPAKNQKIQALNADYASYLEGLAVSFTQAQMDGNSTLMQDLQTERTAVLEQYKIDLQSIQGGE